MQNDVCLPEATHHGHLQPRAELRNDRQIVGDAQQLGVNWVRNTCVRNCGKGHAQVGGQGIRRSVCNVTDNGLRYEVLRCQGVYMVVDRMKINFRHAKKAFMNFSLTPASTRPRSH